MIRAGGLRGVVIFGLMTVGPALAAHADMPISQDQYPIGQLCVSSAGVALSDPFCIFDAKEGAWRCGLPSNPCPTTFHGYWPSSMAATPISGNVNSDAKYKVSFKSETCPDVTVLAGDNNRPFGACDCAAWMTTMNCGEGGCTTDRLFRVDAATTTVFRPADIGAKPDFSRLYCDEASRTTYILTADGGDEGPPSPTGSGVLSIAPGANKMVRAYSKANGLLDDSVLDMLVHDDDVWIVTLTGLQRLNQKSQEWSYWRVSRGRITKDAQVRALPRIPDGGLPVGDLKTGQDVEISGYLFPSHVCVKLSTPTYAWALRSSLQIGGAGGANPWGPAKYDVDGKIYSKPDVNAPHQERWMYWGPSCPRWRPVIPLETSDDGKMIKVWDEFGLVDRSAIAPQLDAIQR